MAYSLWSRGRLFGYSELAYARWAPWMRAGDFEPSALGIRLMPIILGVGPALAALHEAAERAWRAERTPGETARPDDWPASVKHSPEYADAVSLQDEVESLALELRDPNGNVVPTESIWLQDTQRLVALARETLKDQDPDIEFDDDPEPWEPQPARYQILITLAGADRSTYSRSDPDG